ncbi:carboxypeptidase-like regulatory domain-containing protein [Ulvibacterium sp.]|uniref:carboxypeptidase-like regulatory domain-containing protein n=1 Tax=Ulvibacterium sp. TaxID=2665914 RepID=UPI002608F232|nr:carboxypeptidase-like regulatory domain-containing protein [Ulvibacterium sp.]
MRYLIPLLLCIFCSNAGLAQEDGRTILRGKVLYRNSSVVNENVINTTTERATITNSNGEFAIRVKEGDELVFTAVNYQLQIVRITEEILKRNRLVVEVNEKVTELDEVVLSPEDQERYLELRNEQLKGFEYEIDRSTEVENIAMSQTDRGMRDGLNIANIFRALLKSGKTEEENRPRLKVSEALRQIYDDEFFVLDLKLPQDKIDAFLLYCDAQMPAQSLLRKDNEFQLIDFLVTHSETFRKSLDEGK